MVSQKYTENIGNMGLIMINPQKPVINLITIFNRFTALHKMYYFNWEIEKLFLHWSHTYILPTVQSRGTKQDWETRPRRTVCTSVSRLCLDRVWTSLEQTDTHWSKQTHTGTNRHTHTEREREGQNKHYYPPISFILSVALLSCLSVSDNKIPTAEHRAVEALSRCV